MRPYVELTHNWDTIKFRESFDPAHTSIVMADNKDIGMLKLQKRPNELYLGEIQIHPDYQKKGIGTHLIKQILTEAKSLDLPVRLRVLKGNPAHEWYLKLGFTIETELDNCHQFIKQ